LWLLLLNLPQPIEYDESAWIAYREVNELFADKIAEVAKPGDLVWVHDYQLCLVPQMLRDRGLACPIGFFLHVPFSSWETYRMLPRREEIIQGMLGADVLGFHSYQHVDEFRRACLRILDVESEPEAIPLPAHTVRLVVRPVGVDPEHIQTLASSETAQKELAELRARLHVEHVILGVDRLDATKGIPHKLLAFEQLLARHPQWHNRVVLMQIASP
jgi:trehalose-6-phosphate synthase